MKKGNETMKRELDMAVRYIITHIYQKCTSFCTHIGRYIGIKNDKSYLKIRKWKKIANLKSEFTTCFKR